MGRIDVDAGDLALILGAARASADEGIRLAAARIAADLICDQDPGPQGLPAGDFICWTDGACSGNPGPSGAGAVALRRADRATVLEISEFLGEGTNQTAEILAAAILLEKLPEGSSVMLHTDSLYVVQTMQGTWKRRSNREHWTRLDAAAERHESIGWIHVRGHSGDEMNDRVDRLAVMARKAGARRS